MCTELLATRLGTQYGMVVLAWVACAQVTGWSPCGVQHGRLAGGNDANCKCSAGCHDCSALTTQAIEILARRGGHATVHRKPTQASDTSALPPMPRTSCLSVECNVESEQEKASVEHHVVQQRVPCRSDWHEPAQPRKWAVTSG